MRKPSSFAMNAFEYEVIPCYFTRS